MEDGYKLLQSVGDTIFWSDGWLCDVMVPELGRVGRHTIFGELGDHQLTLVVFQGDTHAPTVFAAKIPGFAAPRVGVNNHVDAEGTRWRGAAIEHFFCIEVPR